MGLNEFILGASNLEKINRAPGFFKFTEHNVAAHSYRVTTIAQVLGDIEEHAGKSIDWKILYEKALNHDYTERFIGDIKTPVKYASQSVRDMLQTVEEGMTETFIQEEIPAAFQDVYRRRLSDGKDDTLEGQILAVADKVDLLYESFEEISKDNPDKVYQEMFLESIQTILKFSNLACVDYFFSTIFPDLLDVNFFGKEKFLRKIEVVLREMKH